MSLKAAQQEAANAVAALKQQFGSCEISVNVNGKSIEIMLADQKSRTARLTMPMGVAVDVARYVLALAEHVPPESLEPPTPQRLESRRKSAVCRSTVGRHQP